MKILRAPRVSNCRHVSSTLAQTRRHKHRAGAWPDRTIHRRQHRRRRLVSALLPVLAPAQLHLSLTRFFHICSTVCKACVALLMAQATTPDTTLGQTDRLLPATKHEHEADRVDALAIPTGIPAGIRLAAVERMPDLPHPFILRDWSQVARDLDALAFDSERKGLYLPLIWNDTSRAVNDVDGFALPSYVGDWRQTPEHNVHEGITGLAAVLGSSLAGIDKSKQDERNYAAMLPMHFHAKDGLGLYLNRYSPGGASYWYDLFPNLLFYHCYSLYPDIDGFDAQLRSVADTWQQVFATLSSENRNEAPSFAHTGFDFLSRQPVDRGWQEADAPAGIACLEYLAYLQTGEARYLQTALECLDWLEARQENPFYECLMPYAAYTAARANAELGRQYNIPKLVSWVLDGNNPRQWGAILENWNETAAHGLIGSVYPDHEYAFAMNTFQAAGLLAPVARYDDRLARDLAKWLLNVAVNSRYFYSNAWPDGEHSSAAWSTRYDPTSCIAYEGLRKQGKNRVYPQSVEELPPARPHSLRADSTGQLSWQARFTLPPNLAWSTLKPKLVVRLRMPEPPPDTNSIHFSLRSSDIPPSAAEAGDKLFSVLCDRKSQSNWATLSAAAIATNGTVNLTARGTDLPPGASIELESCYIEYHTGINPQVGGDPTVYGWGRTDLGLYGSVFVGFLAALIEPTDVDGILSINPAATEIFPPEHFPTRLLFNPYAEEQTVQLRLPDRPAQQVDLYDAIANHFIAVRVPADGPITVTIPPKEARLIVACPSQAKLHRAAGQLHCEGRVIDYHFPNEANPGGSRRLAGPARD